MKHADIYKVYPQVTAISGEQCYDENGKQVDVSLSFVQQEMFRLELEDAVRGERDALLSATDWWALGDRDMTTEQAAYRQALRDISDQSDFPNNVTWPEEP